MYGDPALPPDFVSLPYANPDAPKGGAVVFGNTDGFDSLNPFVSKGKTPWQWRFWGYESLMGRSWDEPFTLYGLLASSIRTAPDRSWVEFTLREEARFADGSPVTVEDVIWSFETLGTVGHLRYRGLWSKIAAIEPVGPRSLRITFNTQDRELALLAGMRPVLKKAQWEDKDFTRSGLTEIPIGTGPYVVEAVDAGRSVDLRRNPDYWGRDLPLRRGTHNFDQIRLEFYGDQTVLLEAFKAGALSAIREFNAEKWARDYDFPALRAGEVVKSEIPDRVPSGMTGLVMNTRRPALRDWRVREALILAFNFEFINDTLTGGEQGRITSYFSGTELGMGHGPAEGRVRDLLEPFADTLLPGALEGYSLPEGDGSARNRRNIRKAMALLGEAGWHVVEGRLRGPDGTPMILRFLLRQGDGGMGTVVDLYSRALERLGIEVRIDRVDNAQYSEREDAFDFDLTPIRRGMSLSPGNEQRYYWGSGGADTPGSRNVMGMRAPAADAMIDAILQAESAEARRDAVRALDRVLMAGRYVIPTWRFGRARIAHRNWMRYPERLPAYGDRIEFMPGVWWADPGALGAAD